MAAARPLDAADLAALFRARLDDPSVIPFAVTDQRTGALLGTTSLCDYVPSQQRIEIGGTFFGRQFWGSHVNSASKNMLLGYAFEVLGVHRVAFRCDATNRRSAAAIERLGAQFEGCCEPTAPRRTAGVRTLRSFRSWLRSGLECGAACAPGWLRLRSLTATLSAVSPPCSGRPWGRR